MSWRSDPAPIVKSSPRAAKAQLHEAARGAVGVGIGDEGSPAARSFGDALHAKARRHRFAHEDGAGEEIAEAGGEAPGGVLRADRAPHRFGGDGGDDAEGAVVGDGSEDAIAAHHGPRLAPGAVAERAAGDGAHALGPCSHQPPIYRIWRLERRLVVG